MIAPFPWHALPAVAAEHVRAVGRVRRAFPSVSAHALAAELSALLGHRAEVDIRRAQVARVDLGARGGVVVLVDGDDAIAVELEPELALAAASALAGGKLPRIARGRTVDPEVMGAAAGIVLFLLRTAGLDAFAIDAVDPETARLQAIVGRTALVIDAVVRLGALRTGARIAVPVPELDRTPRLGAAEALARLGATPLSLPVVIGYGTARAADVGSLALGDVVVVDHRLDGCALIAVGATSGTCAVEVEPGRIRVLAGRAELAAAPPPQEGGAAMSDDTSATMQLPAMNDSSRIAEDLAGLPLEVRVEVGRATLAAREWAAISPGDVIALDRRTGDPISLRIGDRIVARGELVDVEGAIGVRITERAS